MKRSFSDGNFLSSTKKAKHRDVEDPGLCLGSESAVMSPPPMKRSLSDGDLSSSKKKKKTKHQGDADPGFFLGSESAIVNPPPAKSSITDGDSSSSSKKKKDGEDPSLSLPLRANISVEATADPRGFVVVFPDEPKPDPKIYLDDAWGKLKPAIRSTFLDEPDDCYNFIEIINAVRLVCWVKLREPLHKLFLEECEIYISAAIHSLEGPCNDDPSVFLPLMEKCWLDFRSKMQFLCTMAKGEAERIDGRNPWEPIRLLLSGRSLWDLGLGLFSKHLFLASQVQEKVISSILVMIKDQRLGKSVDVGQLKNLMSMFNGPSFYKTRFFEKPFLKCASEFYAADAMQVLGQSDISQYLKHVERRLREEKEKCNSLYFFIKFEEPLIEVVEKELLGVHASALLEKDFATLMDECREDDLDRIYDLFSEANLVGHLNDALSSYILKTGKKILAEGSSLAEFKASVDQICMSYFKEDDLLDKTVQRCFKDLGLPYKDRFAWDW